MKQVGMLKYKLHLIKGLYFELVEAWENKEYKVVIGERLNGEKISLFDAVIPIGGWAKLNRQYMCDYYVDIYDGEELKETIWFKDHIRGKRLLITFDSSALGDNIAWMPYCREFQNTYNCHVVVSTFKNFLFEKVYKDLEFTGRGVVVNDIVAQIELGWFWDKNREPINPVTIPLQQSATNILALPYKEIRPEIDFVINTESIPDKYVVISTQSTSGLKYWQVEEWQKVINFLNESGYVVYEISKEKTNYVNLIDLVDKPLETIMPLIYNAKFYIGLSSGLSWLSWALGTHVFMIANFSKEGHEFTSNCTRITNTNVCHGCWNNPLFKFNKGDWYYCPEHEDTPRHFECHTSIDAEQVIKEIINMNFQLE